MSIEIAFIPDRLNEEPIIYIGMTQNELKMSALVSVFFWVPLSVIIGLLVGYVSYGIAVGILMAFGTMWQIGRKLRVLKRGKPKGYHATAIAAWLESHHLKSKTMLRDSRIWDIRRHKIP
ncbi:MAG: TIGR03750 family conjugal transfer protein [Gammaproteobacteria bacterium]